MIHPIAMSGVVAKPHSSAPSKQAIAMSRPVRIPLIVSLDGDTTTQIVEHESLAGLSETELPRKTGQSSARHQYLRRGRK